MKVLLVHNRYQTGSPSGEDTVFEAERSLLLQHGVDVVTYTRSNDEINGIGKAAMPLRMSWSKRTYRELVALIEAEKPDIAHFHNIFYCVTPSAYGACRDMGVPVVQTLHNYRFLCANGLCLYGGRVCTDCLADKRFGRSVGRKCFRDSYLFSFAMARFLYRHTRRGTFTGMIDAFIALTDHQKRVYVEAGYPAEKIFIKPNFLSEPLAVNAGDKKAAVFIGRLSPEKGIEDLLAAWEGIEYPLVIAGDGPLREYVAATIAKKGLSHVTYLGRVDRAAMAGIYGEALFLVFPSRWYEGMSMVVLEALSAGVPVLCSDAVAMASDLAGAGCGSIYPCGNTAALGAAAQTLIADSGRCSAMGKRANGLFQQKYTAENNWKHLYTLYTDVIQSYYRR